MPNKKYKVVINGVEKEFNVTDSKYDAFITKYPSAILVEDFQIDPASAETNAGSQNNTVSNSENSSSVLASEIAGDEAINDPAYPVEQQVEDAEKKRRDNEWFNFAEDTEDYLIDNKEIISDVGKVMEKLPGMGTSNPWILGKALSWLGSYLDDEEQIDEESGYNAEKFLLNNDYNEEADLDDQIDTYKTRKDLKVDATQQNKYYNPNNETTFVGQHYSLEGLNEAYIDSNDFEGYMRRKGFDKQYQENIDNGLYGNNPDGYSIAELQTDLDFIPWKPDIFRPEMSVAQDDSGYFNNDGSVISKGELQRQKDLKNWYNEYKNKVDERGIDKQAIKYIEDNKEEFEGLALIEAKNLAINTLNEKGELYASHDSKKADAWVQENLPAVAAVEKANKQELVDYYSKIKARTKAVQEGSVLGTLGFDEDGIIRSNWDPTNKVIADAAEDYGINIFNTIVGIPGGAWHGVEDLTWWVDSAFESDAESIMQRRMMDEDRFNPSEVMSYTYTGAGKQIELDGINYIVNDDGIYDITNNLNITAVVSPEEAQAIIAKAEAEGVETDPLGDMSGRGFANQLGPVLGDLTLQIVGPKGLGYIVKGVKGTARGLSAVAKANGFKSVAQFNKYLKYQKTGKFVGGRQYTKNQAALTKAVIAGKQVTSPLINLIKKVPIKKDLANVIAFQGLYGGSNGYKSVMQAGIEQGLNNDEITALATQAQFQMSALYMITGPIAPRLKALKAIDDFFLANNIFGNAIKYARSASPNNIVKGFNKSLKAGIQKYLGSNTAATLLAIAKEGSKEVVQENIQQLGEIKLVNQSTNTTSGRDLMTTDYDLKDFATTSLLSFAAGGLMGGGARLSSNRGVNAQNQFANLYTLAQMDPDKVKKTFQSMVSAETITQLEMDEQIDAINNFNKGSGNLAGFYYTKGMANEALPAIALNAKIKKLVDALKDATPGAKPAIKAELDEAIAEQVKNTAADKIKWNNLKDVKKISGQIDQEIDKIKNIVGDNVKSFNTGEELVAYLTEKFKGNQAAIDEALLGIQTNGFFDVDGEIIINKEAAILNKTVSTSSHELLHAIIKSKEGTPEFAKMITEFKEILKGETMVNGDNAFEFLQNKLRGNYKAIADAQGISVDQYLEENSSEWLTGLSDLIVDGEIKFDDAPQSFWKNLLDIVVNFFGITKADGTTQESLNTEFKTGRQAFDFLKNYNKVLADPNEENKKILQKAAKKGIAAQKKNSGRTFQTTQKSTEKDLNNIDDIIKDQGLAALKTAANQRIIGNNIYSMAFVIVNNRYNGLSKSKKESLAAEMVARLYLAQENTKFDGRGTLYGFLNGRLTLRLADEVRENYDKIFKDSDYNQFDTLENNLNIIADDDIESADTSQRNTNTLTTTGVVNTETELSIDKKLVRIVRVLKTPYDTKVSLNVSKKFPLIVELKKEFGKALDIDMKKLMGGKANNSYKNWLVKNRIPLLKNLATDYLINSYPEGIQKSVGGKFSTDGKTFIPNFVDFNVWENSKVDREKTSTENKGSTSGNQIIRKHPNIENVIDEDLFLSKQIILNSDGTTQSLIRGRKESIAKATAEAYGFQKLNAELNKDNSEIKDALINNQENLNALEIASNLVVLESQIENGTRNYQAGMDLQALMKEGISIGLSTAINGAYGDAFVDWYSDITAEQKVYWDENFNNLVNPGIKAFKDNMRVALDQDGVNPDIKKQFEEYLKNNTSKNNEVAMQELMDFSIALMKSLDIKLFSGKGITRFIGGMFGQHHRYLGTTKGTAGYEINQFIKNIASQEGIVFEDSMFSIDMASVQFIKGNQGILKQISNIKAKGWKFDEKGLPVETTVRSEMSRDAKIAAIENKLGTRISNISTSNLQLQSYMMLKVTELISKNPELAPGMFRWFEMQSNVQNHPRGLTSLDGTYISKFPQNEYSDINNYEVNKEHPLYKIALAEVDAMTTLDDQIDKIIENKAKQKNPETISREQAKNIIIAKLLQDKGEHTFASASQMAVFAEAAVEYSSIISNSVAAETNSTLTSIKVKFDNLAGMFGQTSLPKILSDIMDNNIGAVNQSRQLRYLSLDQNFIDEIYNFEGPGLNAEIDAMVSALIDGIDIKDFVSKQEMQKALEKGRRNFQVSKGISVYDFDDTLAFSKSKIIVTTPDGKVKEITPAQFAAQDETLTAQGAKFNFEQFNQVVQGTAGPLVPRLQKAITKFGNKSIFVLTARPQASAPAIYKFLKGLGVAIPLKNIIGLENGSPAAKAGWMVNKVADGYNDFYFVDDAMKNVKAVADVLDVFDVKGKVQQARQFQAANLDMEFNQMMERQSGTKAEARYSDIVAGKLGKNKGRYKFFLPSSADDLRGLTSYTFSGKGAQGNLDQKWWEENVVDPYVSGINAYEQAQLNIKNQYGKILKSFGGKTFRRRLGKTIPNSPFTYDEAIRVHIWTKQGKTVPGLSDRDLKFLNDAVNKDTELSAFADTVVAITFDGDWPSPTNSWNAGNLLSDLHDLSKVTRTQYLQDWNQNIDIIFSKANLNKIEAIHGTRHREALEDIIRRMKSGSNRPSGGNRITNKWHNWVNNSIGTIMFFNRRSAIMQTLSSVNFINWSDNNPLKAGLALANVNQFAKDFIFLFNSDKLKARRGGLKGDLQEQEIAAAAKGGAKNLIAYLLKIGYTPTQMADSFAIASGGATFFRNRTNTYIKQGMSKADAELKAFQDFSKISDETQQSGDPMLISQQQSNWVGRLVLAFQNTPMQYTRLMKKAAQDIKNGRGDLKTNLSKIIYYGAVQNFIFAALSNALFALIPGFDDDEADEEDFAKKEERIIHSMIDTIMRGSGIYGAVASTLKNAIRRYNYEEDKGYMADHTYTLIELANVMPAIGSKFRKLYNAQQTKKFNKDVIAEYPWAVTVDGKVNISPTYSVIGNTTSALFNLPLDRVVLEVTAVAEMLDSRNSAYQRIALALGWRAWDVQAPQEEFDVIKSNKKSQKSTGSRSKNKKLLQDLEFGITPAQYKKYINETKGQSQSKKIKYLKKL